MLKEKTFFLFKWLSLKVLGQLFNPKFLYPIVEYDEGIWEINQSFVAGLSSFELYAGVHRIINLKVSSQCFSSLLDELTHFSGGRKLTLDPAVLESYSHELMQMTKDPKSIYYKSEVLQSPYIVQPTDLIYPNSGLQNENSSQSVHQLNLIWLASHIALIEMILRTYLLNTITPVTLINALSIITGCNLKEHSIKGLQGADGALFWLVTVAARTVTILGINDCTEWLTNHLTGKESSKKEQSESSCDSTYTINTDSLKESADKFLRGLAMANLVALTFHFYCPELAPAEDFLFNFPSTGEMEPAASHHNARAIALICQKNIDLYNVLFLMPDSCNGNIIRLNDSGSTTLNTLNLLGFCSQGLARSPTHRRLQHAAMAGELFVWFTSRLPNREINPIIPSIINYTKDMDENNTQPFQEGFTGLKCKTSDTDDNQINMIPLDEVNDDSNSASGRGTYRLDETFNENQRQVKQSKKQNLQTSYFIRSKTIRLNKNLSDVEKLNSKLKELSTKQLINSKTGGIYFPVDSTDTPRNEGNKQDNVENQDESQNAPTKWNPLEALFKPNVLNESSEVYMNIPSTENHVAETECTDHRSSEVMSYYPVVDYQFPNTTQGNILNCKITNVDTTHVTTTTKSQYLKENPVTEEAQAPYNSQKIDSKSFRHSRSLSHNRMMPTYSSSQHKLHKYEDFNPSRRSGYRISHSRKHPTDHHDKNSRFFKWRHRPSRRKNSFTPYNIDGYSDSDLNTIYHNRNNIEYSSSDCSSSSEQSTEVLGEGIYSNYSSQKRHGHCPTFVNNAESRRTLTQNERRKLYNRERSKRRQRNIPETVNQPYFYGSHPVQQQVHCVYPYETANQKVYTDIHCLPYAPVQPTWIRPPFITNTLNPCPFYATNQPTFVGSPSVSVIPRLHSTSPLSFSHPNNPDQLLVYNLNEQNVLVPESNNPNVHIITEAVVSTESVNLQTEDCSPISNVTIQNQLESRSYPVPQYEIISNQNFEPNNVTSNNSPVIQVPVYYSQAESFFIPFETDSSNVSSTFHHKHNSKFKSKNKSVTNQKLIDNFSELKHSNDFDNDVNHLDGMSLEPINLVISTAQLENYQLSGSNRITSSSDTIEQSENNIHTTPDQYVDNCKSKQSEKQIQEHVRPRKESILPTYLEKRSMKAYKKEINSSENSRSSSGKSQTILNMKENSFKTNENVVNTSKVIIPIHQRRTASVSRTIGIVKPNFNGGQRRHTQDELSLLDVKSQSHIIETGSSNDLKLFVQLQTKSNRRAISNALNYCCLAGPVNETMKRTALEALGCSDGKHFIILLKSQCQYSGLYNYLPIIEKAIRISGTGPSKIENNMVDKYYKYDSGLKRFVEINSTSHMSTIIDAIQLHGRPRNYSTKSYAAQTTNSTKCPLHAK
ncbi:unnamed protein product [Schistosoma mattheei]|uniref:CKK domain-containing protein n=1 Tax=Schistosoma mattheei TaxID=31246 RepID=A0AA85B8W2_9TREM|nr:unnamed protein product [Schistosoma mattheei]